MPTLNELVKIYDSQLGQDPAADANRQQIIQREMQRNPGAINESRGASAGIRALVGGTRQEDKLATLQSRYPEAVPYGPDGDNYLAVNRRDGQPFLYNNTGFDLGDVAEYGREITTGIAGVGAAVATSPVAATGVGAAAPYVAGGLASAGAGALYDKGMEHLYDSVDTRTMGEQFEDYTVEGVLGMLPVDKLKEPASFLARKFVTGPAQDAVRKVVEKYGIKATAGTVGNGMLQSFEAGTQRVGAAMENFRVAAEEMYGGIEKVIEAGFDSMGGRITRITAGENAVNKGQKFITTFRSEADELYKAVDEFIPGDTAIVPDSLYNTAGAMLGKDALGELFEPNLARRIFETINGDGATAYVTTTYASLAQIRSQIGEQIAAKEVVGPGNVGLGNAKKLYAAITEDMKSIAQNQGDEAFEAWNRANEFYRAGSKAIDDVIVPNMTTKGGSEWLGGESVMDRLAKLISKDPKKLAEAKTSGVLNDDDMAEIGAGVLADLGKGTPGSSQVINDTLSPTRMTTQLGAKVMHEESKDILFGKTTNEILDDLRVLGAQLKETDQLVNRSGTGNANAFGAGLGVVGAAVGQLATGDIATAAAMGSSAFLGGVVMPYLTSKGIQSRPFVNWVAQGTKNGTGKEWVRAGARMASKEGLMNVYEGIIEYVEGNTGANNETSGGLLEDI